MKKITALLVALMMLLSASFAMAETSAVGGWAVAETIELSEDKIALFDQAMEELVGVSYEPVAYLGSQVVAGLNHCYLCKATVVYPDAVPQFALVYIYEAADGSVQILNIADLDIASLSVPADFEEE